MYALPTRLTTQLQVSAYALPLSHGPTMVFTAVHAILHPPTIRHQIHACLAVHQLQMLIRQTALLDIVYATPHITMMQIHILAL